MAWNGYWTIGGEEFINGPRTEAYAANAGALWLRPQFNNDALGPMLDQTYTDPATDLAPWYDPNVPESADFFGYYPLDVSGIEDSTRTSVITESTSDGGSVGRLRHGTKTVVYNGVLVGLTDKAVEYGQRWLRRVLLGGSCSVLDGTPGELGFLSVEPELDADPNTAPDVEVKKYQRFLRNFLVNTGPTVTSKRSVKGGCSGAVWMVTFTGSSEKAYEFGPEDPILQGWLDSAVADPWVPGVTEGAYTTAATVFTEVDCGVDTWTPIFDPTCSPTVVPPIPPSIPLGCLDIPATWDRWQATIPSADVPIWGTDMPIITLTAGADNLRTIRIRIYPDSEESLDPNTDSCAWSSDLVVSYLPAGATMTIDAASEEVWVQTLNGQNRRADNLLFTTQGKPVTFPTMTCGYQYIVTLDAAITLDDLGAEVHQVPPVVDLSVVHRVV